MNAAICFNLFSTVSADSKNSPEQSRQVVEDVEMSLYCPPFLVFGPDDLRLLGLLDYLGYLRTLRSVERVPIFREVLQCVCYLIHWNSLPHFA